jgi:hypothetical protein
MPSASEGSDSGSPLYPQMKDKFALITGGTSGIGPATAKALARQWILLTGQE